jgi:molecular chaperone GrpE
MTERKRAGQPEAERRPAGAPPETRRPAGIPAKDAASAAEAQAEAAESVERDLDELLKTKRERDEYLQLAQRARADFENFRKRAARDALEAERRGRASLLRELIPVLDNLERALLAAGVDPAAPEAEDGATEDSLARGVALVHRELSATLERAGVEGFDPLGERFDPEWHEALATRAVEDGEGGGIVVETLERGYRLDGALLRPARVVVSG